MSRPNKKVPEKTINIYCKKCKALLYKYHKGGKGALIKCFIERIAVDYTQQPCTCPNCQQVFARETLIRGIPAYKMISGKVQFK
ncbi:hypothetical protein FLL46_25965 [Aliikangiella coralliicola]|uniref:Zn-ribbon motif protein n=1 Tax=Aliikangiella coralliicola TaxID=2592383 RepID=A0A545TV72_9GAMM|nr:hypothetical protein FLL46_25965 [Aliikangiella coralliicola]